MLCFCQTQITILHLLTKTQHRRYRHLQNQPLPFVTS
ncbi:unnamed protein product [Arabidopsis halleri]